MVFLCTSLYKIFSMKQLKPFLWGVLGAICVQLLCVGSFLSYVHTIEGAKNVASVLGLSGEGMGEGTLARTGDGIVDVVRATSPAVVSIVISKDVPIIEQYYDQGAGANMFGNLFGGFSFPGFIQPQYRQNGTEKKEIGGGSGFFVSADGYVVTNAHVVQDSSAEYTVLLNDGTKYDAKIIAADTMLDVALLKVEAENMPFLDFANSDDIAVGQTVIAIGNALGEFRNTVSVGVVSGLARTIQAADGRGAIEELRNVIQTDAAINSGNSGGPLLDLGGKVIGVNVATSGNASNISFSLPANMVHAAIEEMKTNGRILHPYLGVRTMAITPEIAKQNGLRVDYGAIVLRTSDGLLAVVPGSPADKIGLVENDIILEIDGQRVDQEHPLSSIIRQKRVGDTITVSFLHDGAEKRATVVLEEMPAGQL